MTLDIIQYNFPSLEITLPSNKYLPCMKSKLMLDEADLKQRHIFIAQWFMGAFYQTQLNDKNL